MEQKNGSASTNPQVQRVLERLERVHKTGKEFSALCPAHDDHKPSLSITAGDDGRALLICRSRGCAAKDIVDAIDLKLSDLFPQEWRPKKGDGKITRTDAIRDRSGKVVAYHVRYDYPNGEKECRWQLPDGGWGLRKRPVSSLPLYGSELVDEWPEGAGIVLVEGEKAKDALETASIKALATVTGAGGTPNQEVLEVLKGRRVFIWPDNDEQGRLHMERVAQNLQGIAQEIRWFEWENAPEKGDAADHPAVVSCDLPDVAVLHKELARAPRWKLQKPKESKKPDPLANIISATELWDKEFPEPKWAVPGVIPEGVCILGGKAKMGKSWLAYHLAIAVAAGGVALGNQPVEQGNTLYLALEDGERRLQKRLKKLIPEGEPPKDLEIVAQWPKLDQGGTEALQKWLETRDNPRLIVIDTLKKVRPADTGRRNMYDVDYEALEPLLPLAQKYGVAIVIVHHLNQSNAEDPLDLLSGSEGLIGGVDGAMVLKRERGRADAFLYATHRDLEDDLEMALAWDQLSATWCNKGDAEEYRISQERAAVLKVLGDFPEGLRPKEIYEGLIADNHKTTETAVRKLLQKMASDGQVNNPRYGVYTAAVTDPLHTTGHTGHSGHTTDTYRTEPSITPGHSSHTKSHSSETVTGDKEGGHSLEPTLEPSVTGVTTVTTESSKTSPPKAKSTRLTEEQAEEIKRLIAEGMHPRIARDAVLGGGSG